MNHKINIIENYVNVSITILVDKQKKTKTKKTL